MESPPHVALLAFPFTSHPAPLFALARALSAASPPGSAFSFLTSAKSATSLSKSTTDNLRIFELSSSSQEEEEGQVAKNEDPEAEMLRFMKEAPVNFKKAMEAAVAGRGGMPITCVISDTFIWFAGEMAREMGVPWVAYYIGGPCSLSVHLHTDVLRDKFRVDDNVVATADEDLGFLRGLSGLRVCDLPEGVISDNISKEFAEFLHRVASELPHASAIVLNSFQGLYTEVDLDLASKLKKYLPWGPINLLNPIKKTQTDQFNCIQWLDRQEPASVAYISFGTVACLSPPELVELAEGLEASGVPFIWSLKDFEKEHLPDGFLDRTKERGLVVPWAPQVKVLEHVAVGVYVTHCGWNSVVESVTCGVPMICRPFWADNMLNARAVSQVWKVGVGFEDGWALKKAKVTKALEKVMKEEDGKVMRERLGDFREKAVQAIKQPDGSSINNFKTLLDIVTAH